MSNRDEQREAAFQLYLQGFSLRDIAARVMPESSGGYVTIHRWSKKFGWKEQKAELEAALHQNDHDRYLSIAAESQERQLRIAGMALRAVEMTLDAYFERDEGGNVLGIKLNKKTGMPAIPAVAVVQLLSAAADIEQRVLNLDALAPDEREQVATAETRVVDADPATLVAIGDFLARQALPLVELVDADEPSARPQ